jgi:predicted deacylase
MKIETDWHTYGEIGVSSLSSPIYTIGEGSPVLGITCSVHGDERAGLYIVARLVTLLKQQQEINGTLKIVLAANPAAQFVNSRTSPQDLKDLNRTGRGRRDGTYTERVSARLFDLLSTCDFVINIHEFEMHTQIAAAFIEVGSFPNKLKTVRAIQAFSPKFIWVIQQSSSKDAQYQTTLDSALAEAGIPNFPIETVHLQFITEAEIDDVAQGILRVAAHLGMIDYGRIESEASVPAFTRSEVTANLSGLWEPQTSVMNFVESSTVLGAIVTLPEFNKVSVFAPYSGTILQVRHRQLVSTGTSLFSLGHSADSIVAKYTE